MMYDAVSVDSPAVERDMFGREITTHTRRFSTSAHSTPSRPASRHVTATATPTEESPLLPVFSVDLEDEGEEEGGGGQEEGEAENFPVLSNRDNMNLNTNTTSATIVTKHYLWASLALVFFVLISLNLYFFYSLRALHTHSYHQHQQINSLQLSQQTYARDFNRRLQIIENMTSNADVIKEMHHTESRLDALLQQEQQEIHEQLGLLQDNVTSSIHHTEYKVERKLSHVDEKLAATTTHIKALLLASEANMTREMHSVSAELEAEEVSLQSLHANVTRQVSQLSAYMNASITSVNALVADAKKKIKSEVKEVYASLDQYITSTTAQFAAENDFVKYQLAGSFSLLACLICLYHVTSHLRHFERPDIQRRVLAILWMVPIYSVTSWLQLVFPASTNILSGIRDCYEAYVVYTFFAFLIAVLANTNVQVTSGANISNVHNKVVRLLAMRITDQRKAARALKDAASESGSPSSTRSVKAAAAGGGGGHEQHPITPPCSCLRCRPSPPSTSTSCWVRYCPTCCCCPGLCCCGAPSVTDTNIDIDATTDEEKALTGEAQNTPPLASTLVAADDFDSPRNVAASVLYQCSCMTLQFVLLKPLLAAMPFFFWLAGVAYEEHQYYDLETKSVDWTSPKLYVLMVANISVSLAFYGLLSFYHTTEKDLAWCDPWPKFVCIKGVVFMTFWQYVGLQMMSGMGLVDARAASQIQNLLICIEMFMASIAHFYVFPFEEWGKNYEKEQKKIGLFRDTLALNDFVTDIGLMAKSKPYVWDDDDDHPHFPDEDEDLSSHGRPRRRSSYGGTSCPSSCSLSHTHTPQDHTHSHAHSLATSSLQPSTSEQMQVEVRQPELKGQREPETPDTLFKWEHNSGGGPRPPPPRSPTPPPSSSPGIHMMDHHMYSNPSHTPLLPPAPLPLPAPQKQSRNIDLLLQSPSLAVSSPLQRAAREMNTRLHSRGNSSVGSEDGSGGGMFSERSSEDSSSAQHHRHYGQHRVQSPSLLARDKDRDGDSDVDSERQCEEYSSEHLDGLSPAVTPVAKSTPHTASSTRTDVLSRLNLDVVRGRSESDSDSERSGNTEKIDRDEKNDERSSSTHTSATNNPICDLSSSSPLNLEGSPLLPNTFLQEFSEIETEETETESEAVKTNISPAPLDLLSTNTRSDVHVTPSPQPLRHPASAPLRYSTVGGKVVVEDDSDSGGSVQSV